MSQFTFIVGRNPNVTAGEIPIRIDDPSKKVSSNHCRITYDGSNFYIEDLISTNGTFVDGEKISGKKPVNSSNAIKLGGTYLFSLNHPTIQQNLNAEPNKKVDLASSYVERDYEGEYEDYHINTGNKFFTFINPLLKGIDNGKFYKTPFIWLYLFFAALYLIMPVVYLVLLIVFGDKISNYLGMIFFYWLFIAFNGWICFQLLWNRQNELKNYIKAKHEFKASPIFAHYIKTVGEVFGINMAITGVGISLTNLFFRSRSPYYNEFSRAWDDMNPFNIFGIFGNGMSLAGIIWFPLVGFLIIILFKVVSEFIGAVPTIANNTKK